MRGFATMLAALAAFVACHAIAARTIAVGPRGDVARVSDAARLARDGDTVVIEPGTYVGDVAVWPQSGLTIRARACCVRMVAAGKAAEGKAIFVVKGTDVVIEGIAFEGARVPAGNGAGIRHEGGRLAVRRCRFTGHQMGLLTWNDRRAELVVERSEFGGNHRLDESDGGRPAHQIYVGRIARFELTESHVHSGAVGHLVKSRARVSVLAYNHIADGSKGRASYEVEFPEGGDALLVGNIVQQSKATQNAVILAYGAEGRSDAEHRLTLVHNTIVDHLSAAGPMVRVWPGPVDMRTANNLLAGHRMPEAAAAGFGARDFAVALGDLVPGDYRLSDSSSLAGRAHDLEGTGLPMPDREHVHPLSSRPLPRSVHSPGALQPTERKRSAGRQGPAPVTSP